MRLTYEEAVHMTITSARCEVCKVKKCVSEEYFRLLGDIMFSPVCKECEDKQRNPNSRST